MQGVTLRNICLTLRNPCRTLRNREHGFVGSAPIAWGQNYFRWVTAMPSGIFTWN